MLSSHVRLGLPIGLFPSDFTAKILYVFIFFPMLAACTAHLILVNLDIVIMFSAEYDEAPHYVALSNFLSLRPSSDQIFSTPFLQRTK
jgi:hypothetical protein